MSRSYTQIYTPNLIDGTTIVQNAQGDAFEISGGKCTFSSVGGTAALGFSFASEVEFDTIFILGGNVTALSVTSGAEILASPAAAEADIRVELPLTRAREVNLSFSSAESIKISNIIFCKSLINLGSTKTYYTKNAHAKGGHFYLNGGALVAWQEYKKAQAALSIDYAGREIKNALAAAFEKYKILTFALAAGHDNAHTHEFALLKPMLESADRNTNTYSLELSLTER